MNRSRNPRDALLLQHSALQHERSNERAPRPLPLFLELVRQVSLRDPDRARDALEGLRAYQHAPRRSQRQPRPEVARVAGACLRDHGGDGAVVILVPSLINPPKILDLDEETSLTAAIARMSRRSLLLDWGEARARAELDVTGHVEHLLLPLLRSIREPAALVGYCLGGTMAVAAANLAECERVVTLATPWNFSAYPERSLAALTDMWTHSKSASRDLGALPMEVLQTSFWSLDPERTVGKFAEFSRLASDSPEARRFAELEDWANEGEPLPYPAAEELIEKWFGEDLPGRGKWRVGGKFVSDKLAVSLLNLTAERDLIAPPATAPAGETVGIGAGHVGMIVGSARGKLHAALKAFLTPCR